MDVDVLAQATPDGRSRMENDDHSLLRYPEWQVAYREAVLELDPEKLPVKIRAAEQTILLRFQQLAGKSGHQDECLALRDASSVLRTLTHRPQTR
jgi:hypothetical protein